MLPKGVLQPKPGKQVANWPKQEPGAELNCLPIVGHTVHEVHTLATMAFTTHEGVARIRAVLQSRGVSNKDVTVASLLLPLRRTRESVRILGAALQCKVEPRWMPWDTVDPTIQDSSSQGHALILAWTRSDETLHDDMDNDV